MTDAEERRAAEHMRHEVKDLRCDRCGRPGTIEVPIVTRTPTYPHFAYNIGHRCADCS